MTRDDLNIDAQCSCGCVFVVVVDSNRKVVAKKTTPKPAANIARNDPGRTGQRDSDEEANAETTPREKKKPLVVQLGLAAVGLFLLTAVGFFVARTSGLLASVEEQAKPVESDAAPKELTPIAMIEAADPPAREPGSGDGASADTEFTAPVIRRSTETGSPSLPHSQPKAAAMFKPPPKKEIPPAAKARPRIPVIAAKRAGKTYSKMLEDVFIEYEKTNEMESEAATSGDTSAYHEQLGKTIGLLHQTLQSGERLKQPKSYDQLKFMLAYSYLKAGYLAEAAVLGEQLARFGKLKTPQTKQGAMIAMAATQEANSIHWGVPEEAGELDLMRRLINVIAKRWPDDPQLDLYRMNLAQLYDKFNHPQKAASVYATVDTQSPNYVAAQLAAGSALWGEFRTRASEGKSTPDVAQLRDRAKKLFATGVNAALREDPTPKREILVAKLSIARMSLHAGDLADAEKWLTKSPAPLCKSLTVGEATDDKINVSPGFVRLVFETLFSIRRQLNDSTGAKAALTEMATILGPENSQQLGQLFLGVATNYIDQLSRSKTISRQQFAELSELIEPLKGQNSVLTASNMLWLGESWAGLAPNAANDELRKQCYQKAAAAYEMAMARKDFPKSNLQGAQLRRAQILRQAGDLESAVVLIGKILDSTPNAIGLQIEAAEALQLSAIQNNKPLSLVDVVDGPANSPIWGWNKLVTTLHKVHYSENASEKNTNRLYKARYSLAHCKWLIAKATVDTMEKTKLTQELHGLVSRLAPSIPPEAQPWSGKFNQLIQEINAAK